MLRSHLGDVVHFDDLTRYEWRLQTDVVQQLFITAALFACGAEVVQVDGHINVNLKKRALEHKGGVKRFFNKRCHDLRLTSRRVIVFDTVTTNRMGQRSSGRDKLHFHGAFELPAGWSRAALLRVLEKVFGRAAIEGRWMGRRQFHASSPDWTQHHSHNGACAVGPLGKFLYAIQHAGATYNSLQLNEDGKRSRKAPSVRGQCNRKAARLAQGIPSNFTAEVVFADTASKRAGKGGFEAWVKAERELLPPRRPMPSKRSTSGAPSPDRWPGGAPSRERRTTVLIARFASHQ